MSTLSHRFGTIWPAAKLLLLSSDTVASLCLTYEYWLFLLELD